MTYLYPALVSLLQFELTPMLYHLIIKGKYLISPGILNKSEEEERLTAEYLRDMPTYTYAECPFCHTRCTEKIDTYQLGLNYLKHQIGVSGSIVPFGDEPQCPHFYGYHLFLNLHDRLPVEVNIKEIRGRKTRDQLRFPGGEVPYITSWLISTFMPSYAVLHALPICRVEENQFVPTYTLFMLAYFSEDPIELFYDQVRKEGQHVKDDDEYFGFPNAGPIYTSTISYDLESFAKNGRLGWLDMIEPDLPLRLGQDEQLPSIYQEIPGKKRGYVWANGRLVDLRG